MRKGLNISIMEILFAIFGQELIKKNISILTVGTFIKSFLSILVHRNNNFLLFDSNMSPFRRNKSPFREKASISHFSVTGWHGMFTDSQCVVFFLFFFF